MRVIYAVHYAFGLPKARNMTRHYVYRLDHDTGFAPHPGGRRCTLCGCKKTSVELWAQPGSWIVGIGGKGTGRPDCLIYSMRVDGASSLATLRRHSPRLVAYLRGRGLSPSSRVLVSSHFFYFGRNAVRLPRELAGLIIRQQGCKVASDEDVMRLSSFLARRFKPGVQGQPNNPDRTVLRSCHCGTRCSPRRKRASKDST